MDNERLVKGCREGDQDAWAALIDKYKNLIYSIPIRRGMSRDDTSEIFQAVCLKLLSELSNLRDPQSLGGWLIKVTSHKCTEWIQRQRYAYSGDTIPSDTQSGDYTDASLLELEREQMVREALLQITPRCRKLIQMLFYEAPAIPYQEVARRLSLATGSIGFIRMRCLRQLRLVLTERGFRR